MASPEIYGTDTRITISKALRDRAVLFLPKAASKDGHIHATYYPRDNSNFNVQVYYDRIINDLQIEIHELIRTINPTPNTCLFYTLVKRVMLASNNGVVRAYCVQGEVRNKDDQLVEAPTMGITGDVITTMSGKDELLEQLEAQAAPDFDRATHDYFLGIFDRI